MRFAPLIPAGGAVLDVACGSGRHIRLFARRGHPVVAVDRDTAALAAIAGGLAAFDIAVRSGPASGADAPLGGAGAVDLLVHDLEDETGWPFGERRFAGVVVTNYLHRPLLPAIVAAVANGGFLLYETFARGQERFGRPANPAYLLRPGELLEAVGSATPLRVVAFEEGEVATPRRAHVQRLCAWRPPAPDARSPHLPLAPWTFS